MIYNNIKLTSLPEVIFAHVHSDFEYKVSFKNMKPNLEISYIKAGGLSLDFFGKKITVPEKSFLIMPHKYKYILKALKKEAHIHYTVSAKIESSIITNKSTKKSDSDELFIPVCINPSKRTDELAELLNAIIKEHQNNDSISKQKCGAMVVELLCELARLSKNIENESTNNNIDIIDNRIKKYIEKSIGQKITLSDVGVCIGKNPNYLNQLFKKKNNMSIMSYINLIKMRTIAILAINEDLSLQDAGKKVGITNHNYLSRLFKAKMGMTFSEFKLNSACYTFSLNDRDKIFKNNGNEKNK